MFHYFWNKTERLQSLSPTLGMSRLIWFYSLVLIYFMISMNFTNFANFRNSTILCTKKIKEFEEFNKPMDLMNSTKSTNLTNFKAQEFYEYVNWFQFLLLALLSNFCGRSLTHSLTHKATEWKIKKPSGCLPPSGLKRNNIFCQIEQVIGPQMRILLIMAILIQLKLSA